MVKEKRIFGIKKGVICPFPGLVNYTPILLRLAVLFFPTFILILLCGVVKFIAFGFNSQTLQHLGMNYRRTAFYVFFAFQRSGKPGYFGKDFGIIAEVKNGFAYQVFIVHSSSLLYNGHWNNCFPVQVQPTEAAHL